MRNPLLNRRPPPKLDILVAPRQAFVVALIAVLALWCALTCLGCGPRRRTHAVSSVGATDSVGPLHITYHDGADNDHETSNDLVPSQEERLEFLRRLLAVLADYERHHNWKCPIVSVRVYPTIVSGVPCGVTNGGGCYAPLHGVAPAGTIYVTGSIKEFYHELNHLRLWLRGDPIWNQHSGPEWDRVWSYVPPWDRA